MNAPRTSPAKLFVKLSLTLSATALLLARGASAQALPPVVVIQESPAPASQTPAATPTPRPAAPALTSPTQKAARESKRLSLTGRVVGEAGEPIPDAGVSAFSRAAGSNVRGPQTALSDESGNFRLNDLDPGLYQLNVFIPGFVTETDPATGRPGNLYRPGEDALVRLVRGGVVTGTVTDAQGQPLVQLTVRAVRVRDLDGAPPESPFPSQSEDRTDDRGVYRIYGLRPGFYVVYAGGPNNSAFAPTTAYGGNVPTFYPSGTRDTAAEVAVRGGQESAGIDIRYRDEPGRRVTGTVEWPASLVGEFAITINLTYPSTALNAGSTYVTPNSSTRAFSFEGVADGDYDLQATTASMREGTVAAASAPQRISVRGGDLTGLRVTLAVLANASGTLRIEPAAEAERASEACKAVRTSRLPQETLVTAAAAEQPRPAAAGRLFSRFSVQREAAPDEAGSFTLRALEPGRYRLAARLFDEALYVRSIQTPGPAPAAATPPRGAGPQRPVAASTKGSATAAATTTTAARDVFDLKQGQQLTGLVVSVAEGAASLAGTVAPQTSAEGSTPTPLPPFSQLRVHLVPQERERAADLLRYYEAPVAADGTFVFRNLAPGRYLALARPAPTGEATTRPAAWDAGAREILRREAESANTTVELQPCQRTADFTLRFPPK